MQVALEEAEAALEQEEGKSLKVQLELTQLKQSTVRKLAEREDELENLRKNHQRQLESLQNMIDAEQRSKSESIKNRKKQEADLAELEVQLEGTSRAAGDAQKIIKKLQAQVKV